MGSMHCYCDPGVNKFLSISNKTGFKQNCEAVLRTRSIRCMLCFALFISVVFLSCPVEGQDRRSRTRSRGDGGIAFLMDNWLFRPGTSTSTEAASPTTQRWVPTSRQDLRRSRGRIAGVQRPPTTQESITSRKLTETVHQLVPDIKTGTAPTATLRKSQRKNTLHFAGDEQKKTTLYKRTRPVTQRQKTLGTRKKIEGTEPTVTDRQVKSSIHSSIETSIQTPARIREELRTTRQKLRGTEATLPTTRRDEKKLKTNVENNVDSYVSEEKKLREHEDAEQKQKDEAWKEKERIKQEEELVKEEERKRNQRERLEKEKMIKEIKEKLKKQREAEEKKKLEEEKRKREQEERKRKDEEEKRKKEEEKRKREEEEKKRKEEEKMKKEEEEKRLKEELEKKQDEKEEVTTQRQKRQEPKSEPEDGDIYLDGGDVEGTGNIAIYRSVMYH